MQPATLATREWTIVGVDIEGTLVIVAVLHGHVDMLPMAVVPVQGPMGVTIWPTPYMAYTHGETMAEALMSASEVHTQWVSESGPIGADAAIEGHTAWRAARGGFPASVTTPKPKAPEVQADDKPRRSWFRWPWGRK